MSVCSIQTTIFNITVVHCTPSPGDARKEHYCVDANGYVALYNLFLKQEHRVTKIEETTGWMAFQKVQIKYNPNLDGGGNHGLFRKNGENCKAEKIIP